MAEAGKKLTKMPRHRRLANETDNLEPSQVPFTSGPGRERALALLRKALAPGDMPSNTETDSFFHFVIGLESLRANRDPARVARRAAHEERRSEIHAAFEVLARQLPPLLPHYDPTERFLGWLHLPATPEMIERERQKRAAFEMLVTALDAAKASGLMPLERVEAVPTRWHDYAPRVAAVFRDYVPRASKAAEYRFVEAIIPDLSGIAPTYQAVEKHLKARRYVNRDKTKPDLS